MALNSLLAPCTLILREDLALSFVASANGRLLNEKKSIKGDLFASFSSARSRDNSTNGKLYPYFYDEMAKKVSKESNNI
jgi:hypothetical protein